MKKLFLTMFCLMAMFQFSDAAKPVLKFNNNGKFKIVQFTDVHFILGNPKSDISLERINEVLDIEKPDLVIFTGDVIYGAPAAEGLRKVVGLVADRNIPFGVTFGNHDDEQGLSKKQLFDVLNTIPGNLTDSVAGVSGASNYILNIKSANGNSDKAVIYCMDSHAYSQIKEIKGYDYIKNDQVNWYRENSKKITSQNGGRPLPALAFFHIPLPEYTQAANDETKFLVGIRQEKACAPALNTGLFASMREMGDVKGIFVGHDHNNDYSVVFNDILLAYGRYTGGNTVYNKLPNGARVIELTEGKPEFDSWIITKGGEISNKINFPNDFHE